MSFDYQNRIDFLLENASPNILYRVKKEILKEDTASPEMLSLQAQILKLPKVKKAFACQRENGFFGSVLHGGYFDGFDSTVELLKKNGIALTEPHMVKAKEALIHWKDYEKDHNSCDLRHGVSVGRCADSLSGCQEPRCNASCKQG